MRGEIFTLKKADYYFNQIIGKKLKKAYKERMERGQVEIAIPALSFYSKEGEWLMDISYCKEGKKDIYNVFDEIGCYTFEAKDRHNKRKIITMVRDIEPRLI